MTRPVGVHLRVLPADLFLGPELSFLAVSGSVSMDSFKFQDVSSCRRQGSHRVVKVWKRTDILKGLFQVWKKYIKWAEPVWVWIKVLDLSESKKFLKKYRLKK